MTLAPDHPAVQAATKAFGDHVKAHSIPESKDPFGAGLSYALNPSVEECLTVALTAALPHLPHFVGIMHGGQDPEDHARSFNQGYVTAVAQMEAPDDRVMDSTDWLQECLDQAQADGIRRAANNFQRRWPLKRGTYKWLHDFADSIYPSLPTLPNMPIPKVGTDA